MNRPFAWEKSYPPGVSWDAPIEVSTVSALLDEGLARSADRAVFDFRDRAISYRELAQQGRPSRRGVPRPRHRPGLGRRAVPAEHALPPDRLLRLHEGRHPGGPHERARGRARARPQAQGFGRPRARHHELGGASAESREAQGERARRPPPRRRRRRLGAGADPARADARAATASRRSPTSSAMPAAPSRRRASPSTTSRCCNTPAARPACRRARC